MKKILISIIFVALLSACAVTSENGDTTTTQNDSSTNVAETTVEATLLGTVNYNNEKVIWGPGNTVDHQRPTDPVALQEKYKNLNARFILDDEKVISLTFDEGYENGFTPSVLKTLKEKNVKAVFFLTYDFVERNPELVKQMIDEGHVIGNHTYRHYTLDEVSTEEATKEIVYLHEYMKKNFNYEMKYFRFPKGEFSEATLALVKSLGYKSIFWSFAYADWDANNPADPQSSLQNITNSTHNGAILLLHNVSPTNANILGDVIDNIHKQGYSFTIKL